MGLLDVLKSRKSESDKLRHRTDVLNYLIRLKGYRRYLEIGVRTPKDNFDKIRAQEKFGVEPNPRKPISYKMTSDAFFEQLRLDPTAKPFHLVFVDGLHLATQVERDVHNALDFLGDDGTIVLHDCNPLTADAQIDDYDGKKLWNGTVWKAWAKLRAEQPGLSMQVIDMDHGLGIIRRGRQVLFHLDSTDYDKMDFALLDARRKELLNLVDVETFKRSLLARS